MKSILKPSPLPVVPLGWAVLAAPATAQVSPDFTNSKIVVIEQDRRPRLLDHDLRHLRSGQSAEADGREAQAIRHHMMQRRILEEYAEFLSPLRLPHTLKLFASDCGGNEWDSPYYNLEHPRHQYVLLVHRRRREGGRLPVRAAAKSKLWTSVSREQYVAGLFTAVLMHETGHALFDQLDIPVFGREDAGADEIASLHRAPVRQGDGADHHQGLRLIGRSRRPANPGDGHHRSQISDRSRAAMPHRPLLRLR